MIWEALMLIFLGFIVPTMLILLIVFILAAIMVINDE